MNPTLNLILSAALIANVISCKTTENPEASLTAARSAQDVGAEVFGCYIVKKIESTSKESVVTDLKSKATKVCLSKKPVTLLISDAESRDLLKWSFTHLEPFRCPSCYALKGGAEYSATIAMTIVPTVFNMTLETRGFGGAVRLTLEQILDSAPAESAAQFKEITCGDHWRKVIGMMPTSKAEASIKISGDSQRRTALIPAKVSRKSGEILFEATDRSGTMLRIITESGKFYGVFRDSKTNDESDLGQCYSDVVEPGPLN